MNKIFLVSIILLSSLFSRAQFSSASLTAAGLTCAMCTKAIYNSIEKLPFVSKVDADIKSSAFNVSFREGAAVDPDALKNAVEEAGFSVAKLKLTGNFNQVQVSNDAHVMIGGKNFHFLKVNDKSLNGSQTITLVDKSYVTAKEFKKYKASSDHPCVETGQAQECCSKNGATHAGRIYHVTL